MIRRFSFFLGLLITGYHCFIAISGKLTEDILFTDLAYGAAPKQQKIFVNELCNHISHFDDIEEHLNDFIVQDTKDYLRKQHIIPSEEDLESLVDASHILQAFPTRTPTLDYYKSTAMSCDEQDNIQHSNQNINILIPRKKSTN